MTNDFTIMVLLYGDYPDLAERCLRSIVETIRPGDLNLRVGMNAVGDATRDWVRAWVPEECLWESRENIHKYPLMRQMIHGDRPVDTTYTMWFDDDSYLAGYELDRISPSEYWLQRVEHAMVNSDMIGSLYKMSWQGNQREWVKAQPWYNGKDPADRGQLAFATGGWWTIRTDILYGWDYPWSSLDHRGGDAMLGELMHQQGFRLNAFRDGVHINADDKGRESKAPKRGFDQKPIGFYFDPAKDVPASRPAPPPVTEKPPREEPVRKPFPAIIEL